MRDRNWGKDKEKARVKGEGEARLSEEINGSTVSEGVMVGDETRGTGTSECVGGRGLRGRERERRRERGRERFKAL